LAKSVLQEIEKTEDATAAGQGLHLCVAIDYSSREAIARVAANATVAIAGQGQPSPELLVRVLTHSLAADGAEVDLLIRTGGEQRLSDFLLWECAYAELIFTDRMWPEFDEADLDAALDEFSRRERRFGGVPASPVDRGAVSLAGSR
jgi:undecaprenyl diphosphate synthase